MGILQLHRKHLQKILATRRTIPVMVNFFPDFARGEVKLHSRLSPESERRCCQQYCRAAKKRQARKYYVSTEVGENSQGRVSPRSSHSLRDTDTPLTCCQQGHRTQSRLELRANFFQARLLVDLLLLLMLLLMVLLVVDPCP